MNMKDAIYDVRDRQKRLEKQKEKCERENKEFNPKMKHIQER